MLISLQSQLILSFQKWAVLPISPHQRQYSKSWPSNSYWLHWKRSSSRMYWYQILFKERCKTSKRKLPDELYEDSDACMWFNLNITKEKSSTRICSHSSTQITASIKREIQTCCIFSQPVKQELGILKNRRVNACSLTLLFQISINTLSLFCTFLWWNRWGFQLIFNVKTQCFQMFGSTFQEAVYTYHGRKWNYTVLRTHFFFRYGKWKATCWLLLLTYWCWVHSTYAYEA